MDHKDMYRAMTRTEFRKEMTNPFYKRLWKAIYEENKNVLIIICGGGGTGKSYTAIKIASSIDPSFNINTIRDRVLMRPKEFAKVVVEGNLKRGNAIILDEAGTAVNAREWYSFNNKVINYIMQTFRNRNLFVIFTVPSMDYIDKQIRKLFHYFLEAKKVKDNKNICKVFELEFNKITGKLYTKRPFFIVDHKRHPVHEIQFSKASDELLEIYEDMQKEGKHEIQQEVFFEIERIERRRKKERTFKYDLIPDDLIKLKSLDRSSVARYFKIDPSRAYQVLEKWYALGFVEKRYEGNKAYYDVVKTKT
jgi:hypothetical protein